MASEKLILARQNLDEAIKELDLAGRTWSECVTSLHMAEINMRVAQKRMRECYGHVCDILNSNGLMT